MLSVQLAMLYTGSMQLDAALFTWIWMLLMGDSWGYCSSAWPARQQKQLMGPPIASSFNLLLPQPGPNSAGLSIDMDSIIPDLNTQVQRFCGAVVNVLQGACRDLDHHCRAQQAQLQRVASELQQTSKLHLQSSRRQVPLFAVRSPCP